MNIYDLTKTVHSLRLIHKYEGQSIQQAGMISEARCQLKNLAALGEADELE